MVKFRADQYYSLAKTLSHLLSKLAQVQDESHQSFVSFKEFFARIEQDCQTLDLSVARMRCRRIIHEISTCQIDSKSFSIAVDGLQECIQDDLSTKLFFCVQTNRSEWFESVAPFGDIVAKSFPSTSFDIAEAGKCYVLGRYTASVFHLMRVLEQALKTLAARFGIPSGHTNWHNILEGIEKSVREMASDPHRQADWKEQQEFYSQCASHFMVVKDAWRNYTAHARGKFTNEEAESIYTSVGLLMRKLSTRLSE